MISYESVDCFIVTAIRFSTNQQINIACFKVECLARYCQLEHSVPILDSDENRFLDVVKQTIIN